MVRNVFGGSIILREAYQLPNGDLATKFPTEAIWATRSPLHVNLTEAENCQEGIRPGSIA